MVSDSDKTFLRAAVAAARRAREHGNHPFGAVLVGPGGEILLEAENTVLTSGDATGHAELNLVREATPRYAPELLEECTLYASTEPCAMCAGAVYWGNIGRVVFALSGERLYQLVRNPGKNPSLAISCREVFERGIKRIRVEGPVEVEGAEEVHAGFWD
ncbi:MAG TPA: nucleoside deaminase [Anaerolineaceae bacterium]